MVELLGFNNYSMRGLIMEQDLTVGGGLELTEVVVKDGNLTGRVVNRTSQALTDVRVLTNGAAAEVGSMAPGANSERFTLNLAAMGGGKPGQMVRTAGAPLPPGVVVTVQGPGDGSIGPQRPGEMERQQSEVWSATFNRGQQSTAPGTIVLAGWTAEPIGPVSLPDLGRVVKGANLVYTRLQVPVDLANGGDLPAGLVVGQLVEGTGWSRTPISWVFPPGTYTFALTLPALDPAAVAAVALHAQVFNGAAPALEVHNWKSDSWSTVQVDRPLADWPDLVRSGGLMEVRITGTGMTEMNAPTVSVKGVAR